MLEPNKVWAEDITYIATDEGWLFLAVLIDLFSPQVIDWRSSPGCSGTSAPDCPRRLAMSARCGLKKTGAPINPWQAGVGAGVNPPLFAGEVSDLQLSLA